MSRLLTTPADAARAGPDLYAPIKADLLEVEAILAHTLKSRYERIVAIVVAAENTELDPEELRSWVRSRLRSSKTPDKIILSPWSVAATLEPAPAGKQNHWRFLMASARKAEFAGPSIPAK